MLLKYLDVFGCNMTKYLIAQGVWGKALYVLDFFTFSCLSILLASWALLGQRKNMRTHSCTHQYSDSNWGEPRRHCSLHVDSLYGESVQVFRGSQSFKVQNLKNWQLPCHGVNAEKPCYLRIQAFSSDSICEVGDEVSICCLQKKKIKKVESLLCDGMFFIYSFIFWQVNF